MPDKATWVEISGKRLLVMAAAVLELFGGMRINGAQSVQLSGNLSGIPRVDQEPGVSAAGRV